MMIKMGGSIIEFKNALKHLAKKIQMTKGYKQGNVYVLLNALQSNNQDLFISRFLRLMNAYINEPTARECIEKFNELLPLTSDSFKKIGYIIVSALMSVQTIKEAE